jgi:ubiquinone/menaquinone biosynthesis C-methylase UbiE
MADRASLEDLLMATTMRTTRKPYKGPPMEGPIATWYARNTAGDIRGYRKVARAVADQVPPGGRILEVAPGPGYLAIEIAKLGDFLITGLDISRSFVRIATENARRAGVAIEFRHGNASDMPFADESFDFVLCRAAFKNFADPIGAIDEIHRVLLPGGRASIFDLRKGASREAIAAEVRAMGLSPLNALLTRWSLYMLLKNAYSDDALQRMVAQSRFDGCEIVHDGIGFELRLAK